MFEAGEGLLFIETRIRGSRPLRGTGGMRYTSQTFSPNLLGAAQGSYPGGKPMTLGFHYGFQAPVS